MGFFGQAMKNGKKQEARRPAKKSGSTSKKKKRQNPEGSIQDGVMKYFNDNGFMVVRINSSVLWSPDSGVPVRSYLIFGLGTSKGLNDVIVFHAKYALLVEIKVPGKYLDPAQKIVKAFAESKGLTYHVCHSVTEAKAIHEHAENRYQAELRDHQAIGYTMCERDQRENARKAAQRLLTDEPKENFGTKQENATQAFCGGK